MLHLGLPPCWPCAKLAHPPKQHHTGALALPGEANALQFGLARPFAPSKQTPASGKWLWVGLPQAVLVNGKGFYGDCDLIGGLSNNDGVATHDTTCNVTTSVIAPGMGHAIHMASCMSCLHAESSGSANDHNGEMSSVIVGLQLHDKQLVAFSQLVLQLPISWERF